MNHQETHDLKRKTQRRRTARIVLAAVVFLVGALCVFSCFYPAETWKYYFSVPKIAARQAGELRIHFLDVGQGDCSVIEFPDGRSMVIDGGDGSERSELVLMRYLQALKIKKPDFVLLTHTDSDHVGALDKLLKHKGAGVAYYPKIDDFSINAEYAEFRARLQKSSAEKRYSQAGETIASADERYPYRLLFLSPKTIDNPDCQYNAVNDGDYDETDINDASAVVWLDYFGVSALFTGDAGTAVEQGLIRAAKIGALTFAKAPEFDLSSTEILKVAHHGSKNSTCAEFVDYLNVKTSVISCGLNNLYAHPHSETLSTLKRYGSEIYRTDQLGTVVITISASGNYKVSSSS